MIFTVGEAVGHDSVEADVKVYNANGDLIKGYASPLQDYNITYGPYDKLNVTYDPEIGYYGFKELKEISGGLIRRGTLIKSNISQELLRDVIELTSEKLVAGNTILGVTGNSTNVNTSDANAVAADIDTGKTAYVNGQKITGTSTAKAEKEALEQQIEDLRQELATITDADDATAEMQTIINNLETELTQLKTDNATLTAEKAALQAELDEIEKELDDINDESKTTLTLNPSWTLENDGTGSGEFFPWPHGDSQLVSSGSGNYTLTIDGVYEIGSGFGDNEIEEYTDEQIKEDFEEKSINENTLILDNDGKVTGELWLNDANIGGSGIFNENFLYILFLTVKDNTTNEMISSRYHISQIANDESGLEDEGGEE